MCSSGSGTPKANGTQECECNITLNFIAKSGETDFGGGNGYFNGNFKYRGRTITELYAGNRAAVLLFNIAPGDLSDIKIEVNGKIYIFTRFKTAAWKCKDARSIFRSGKNYSIKFLN